MIGDSGYTIQGGGDPKRRWSKGCFSPTSGRLPGILKEKEVEGVKCPYCGSLKIWVDG
jgi:hypothetical protein